MGEVSEQQVSVDDWDACVTIYKLSRWEMANVRAARLYIAYSRADLARLRAHYCRALCEEPSALTHNTLLSLRLAELCDMKG